jgi:CubicO group peptidase (beta-lactamase class C family)
VASISARFNKRIILTAKSHTMKSKIIFALLLCCATSVFVSAQDLAKEIEQLLAEQYEADGPGGAILVARKGNVLYEGGFGMANIEATEKNTAGNIFKIGSITKQYTAVAILMLEEQGKLNTSDLLTRHLPDYPEHGITIAQLLNHTAGVPSYTNFPTFLNEVAQTKTPEAIMASFKDLPLDFDPGTDFSYSNSGYIVLGILIEKLSGQDYGSFIEENIFKKIGMNSTYYGRDSDDYANMATGYSLGADGFEPAMKYSMTFPYAAGSIISTVGDQFMWIKAIRDNKLISAKSKQKAWANTRLPNGELTNYGFGWMMNDVNGSASIEHGGGIFGFVSSGIYVPEEDVFVSILTNRDGVSPDEIAVRIAGMAVGRPYADPPKIDLPSAVLKEYVAIYEFKDGSTRTITEENGQLYSQRTGSTKLPIYPYAENKFFFADNFTRLEFKRNNMNRIGSVATYYRIDEAVAKRTDKEIVEKVAVDLPLEKLERLVGSYELAPGFIMKVFISEGKLYGQATGQQAFELSAKDDLNFFLTLVDAEIEFVESDDGTIESLILHQGGQHIPGKKIED